MITSDLRGETKINYIYMCIRHVGISRNIIAMNICEIE